MHTTDHELLIRIDERVERLERTLLGNGQPGNCTLHSTRIGSLERWRARTTGAFKILAWVAGIFATAAGALVAALRG